MSFLLFLIRVNRSKFIFGGPDERTMASANFRRTGELRTNPVETMLEIEMTRFGVNLDFQICEREMIRSDLE